MGIAKVKRITETTLTSVSKGPGTYPYMAPEMFRTGHHGPPVDIYSPGCLLIELFGRRVWPGLDGPDIMVQIMGTYNTPPPHKCQIAATSRLPLIQYVDSCVSWILQDVPRVRKF